jgi:hypothetical protein
LKKCSVCGKQFPATYTSTVCDLCGNALQESATAVKTPPKQAGTPKAAPKAAAGVPKAAPKSVAPAKPKGVPIGAKIPSKAPVAPVAVTLSDEFEELNALETDTSAEPADFGAELDDMFDGFGGGADVVVGGADSDEFAELNDVSNGDDFDGVTNDGDEFNAVLDEFDGVTADGDEFDDVTDDPDINTDIDAESEPAVALTKPAVPKPKQTKPAKQPKPKAVKQSTGSNKATLIAIIALAVALITLAVIVVVGVKAWQLYNQIQPSLQFLMDVAGVDSIGALFDEITYQIDSFAGLLA